MPPKVPVPAGWYSDRRHQFRNHYLRYWDGGEWKQWVVDSAGAEPFVERERKLSFDRLALLHPFWAAVAWATVTVLALFVMEAVFFSDPGAGGTAIGGAIGIAIVAPYVVFQTRRRLQKPPPYFGPFSTVDDA